VVGSVLEKKTKLKIRKALRTVSRGLRWETARITTNNKIDRWNTLGGVKMNGKHRGVLEYIVRLQSRNMYVSVLGGRTNEPAKTNQGAIPYKRKMTPTTGANHWIMQLLIRNKKLSPLPGGPKKLVLIPKRQRRYNQITRMGGRKHRQTTPKIGGCGTLSGGKVVHREKVEATKRIR